MSHSIVSTLRMQERSVWEFFGKFFRGVATGEEKYLSLLGLGAGYNRGFKTKEE